MPIYTYTCEKCKKEVDKLVTLSTADSQKCDCEEDAKLVKSNRLYATGINLKGNWFKTSGTY